MQLMVISSPVNFKGEGKLINSLFDNGLEVFHLRKPEASLKDYRTFLQDVDPLYQHRVALHQFHELSAGYGIMRLHFPEKLRNSWVSEHDVSGRLNTRYKGKILSTSVHQADEVGQLQDFDYAFLGPVFDSYSKSGYKGIFSEEFKLTSQKRTKVIALGGIGLNTIGRMKRMGFDGAAMLGWIWNDPLKAIDNFNQVKCWVRDHM